MKIREIMSPDLDWANCYDSIEEVVHRMRVTKRAWLPMRNGAHGEVIGLIGERDVLEGARNAEYGADITPVKQIPATQPAYCFDDEDVPVAEDLMRTSGLDCVLIINRYRDVVGFLSAAELGGREMRHLCDLRA